MKLFVYGTLKRGRGNHSFLKGAKFLGEGHTGPGYKLINQGLPFLVEDATGEGCSGELFEITNLQLKRIDFLEGHPEWYVRDKIPIYVNGDAVNAFCYIMPKERITR